MRSFAKGTISQSMASRALSKYASSSHMDFISQKDAKGLLLSFFIVGPSNELHVYPVYCDNECKFAGRLRLSLIAFVCSPDHFVKAAALPVGALLDRVGPRYTSLLGAIVFAAGNLVFPLDYRRKWKDALVTI